MQVKTNYDIARGIVRRYMADYTGQRTAPKSIKGGFFAVIIKDTGDVWLSETQSFQGTMTRVGNKKSSQATVIKDAIKRGSDIELWLLTQPARFSAQALENELYEANLLAARKKPVLDGEGKLYCVRHRTSNAYFVVSCRQDIAESTILNGHLMRLANMGTSVRNAALSQFVQDYAEDILRQMNFDIIEVDRFDNREDEWLKRQCYIDSAPGENLNFLSVD